VTSSYYSILSLSARLRFSKLFFRNGQRYSTEICKMCRTTAEQVCVSLCLTHSRSTFQVFPFFPLQSNEMCLFVCLFTLLKKCSCRLMAAYFMPIPGAQGLWVGRAVYRATPAVTRALGFSCLNRRIAPFSRLLQYTRGCGGPIPPFEWRNIDW
jgi:hypothetical protein